MNVIRWLVSEARSGNPFPLMRAVLVGGLVWCAIVVLAAILTVLL